MGARIANLTVAVATSDSRRMKGARLGMLVVATAMGLGCGAAGRARASVGAGQPNARVRAYDRQVNYGSRGPADGGGSRGSSCTVVEVRLLRSRDELIATALVRCETSVALMVCSDTSGVSLSYESHNGAIEVGRIPRSQQMHLEYSDGTTPRRRDYGECVGARSITTMIRSDLPTELAFRLTDDIATMPECDQSVHVVVELRMCPVGEFCYSQFPFDHRTTVSTECIVDDAQLLP